MDSELKKRKVLLIDDDRSVHISIKHILKEHFLVQSALNYDEAVLMLSQNSYELILLDLHLAEKSEGLKIIPEIKKADEDCEVIVISGDTQRDSVAKALQLGAAVWLVKDFSAEQLLLTMDSVLLKRKLLKERSHHTLDRKRGLQRTPLVGSSPAMQSLLKDIEKIKRSKANVLISGETGTGKELIARHIGAIDGRPFISVDSATITSSMAESLLFGHEKGAFTGAITSAKGVFEEADGGAVYFDELGNMPLEIQAKLLRVLQEKEITRVGLEKSPQFRFSSHRRYK